MCMIDTTFMTLKVVVDGVDLPSIFNCQKGRRKAEGHIDFSERFAEVHKSFRKVILEDLV